MTVPIIANQFLGLLLVIGGTYAYISKGSFMSLFMALFFGCLLVIFRRNAIRCFSLSGLLSLIMAYRYISNFVFIPSGLISLLALLTCLLNASKV